MVGQAELPVARAREHVRAFQRAGWQVLPKRGKGSHWLLRKDDHPAIITLPEGTVKRTLLASQIKQAGLTNTQYLKLFKKRR